MEWSLCHTIVIIIITIKSKHLDAKIGMESINSFKIQKRLKLKYPWTLFSLVNIMLMLLAR